MNQKTIRYMVMCACLLVSSLAFGVELKTEPEVVQLIGTFVKPEHKDEETGKKSRYYAIKLEAPVDVAKDDFGNAEKGVKIMQLVLMGDSASAKTIVKKKVLKKIEIQSKILTRLIQLHFHMTCLKIL